MISQLYEKVLYSKQVEILVSKYIREYDMSKANINVLYREGAITKQAYDHYYSLPKQERQVAIGLLQRDNKPIADILKSGLIRAKRDFFIANDIQDQDILSIKNDAIFILGNKPIKTTKIDNVEFIIKNIYTSFYKTHKIEFYYYNDRINHNEILDCKGLGSSSLELHKDYFYEVLKIIFDTAEKDSIKEAMNFIKAFNENYSSLSLDINYYRKFNPESVFSIKPGMSRTGEYSLKFADNNMKPYIDISYNLSILMNLYKLYSKIYFKH